MLFVYKVDVLVSSSCNPYESGKTVIAMDAEEAIDKVKSVYREDNETVVIVKVVRGQEVDSI